MEKDIQRKSLEFFFRSEYKKLAGYIRKNLEDRFLEASPEDIIQDVALSLLSKLDLDAQIGNLTGYIYQSVRNKITDYQRKKRMTVSLESYQDKKTGINILNGIEDETLTEKRDYENIEPEMLHEAIKQLKSDEQAVIMATVYQNRSFEELSAEWGIPAGTLLSRKHRALAKLQRLLINQKN